MGGISNFQIEETFKKISDEDLLDDFVSVFPSNYMNKFINHTAMISDKGKYPLIIGNTDASNKSGTHWWSTLDIEPINQDDKKTIHKHLLGIEQMDRTDKKLTLCKIKFNLGASKELAREEIDSLSETARNFFYFIQAFGIKLKLRRFVNIWMVEDRLRDLDSATCRIFLIHFYENLFNPNENSKIQNETKLEKKYSGKVIK